MSRSTRAFIDLAALQHNFNRVGQFAPGRKIMAVVKANGYGHGMEQVAKAMPKADAFAVANIDEGMALRTWGIDKPVLLLSGFHHQSDLADVLNYNLTPIVHNFSQLDALISWPETSRQKPVSLWCKIDTGMHRLGFDPAEVDEVLDKITNSPALRLVGMMSHFACADDENNSYTTSQISIFEKLTEKLTVAKSLANSAGIVAWNESHLDWLRPGIMLYGSSPMLNKSAADLGLLPVMKLESEVIAIKKVNKDETIGYGGDWQCPENMSVAVVAIGYGDGYPRTAGRGNASVFVNGKPSRVIGRVSMDMITVDLRGIENIRIGDKVELWGPNVPIDEVATACNTIAYELMCQVTNRVPRVYQNHSGHQ